MHLLLDECLPAPLRKALPAHQVSTVPEVGWSGVKNGKLFVLAAMTSLPASVFVLDAPSNKLPYLLPLVPILEVTLARHDPGAYVMLRTET
jgi:hypothetical protein